jgi:hypothetical protein
MTRDARHIPSAIAWKRNMEELTKCFQSKKIQIVNTFPIKWMMSNVMAISEQTKGFYHLTICHEGKVSANVSHSIIGRMYEEL